MNHHTEWTEAKKRLIQAVSFLGFPQEFGEVMARQLGSPEAIDRITSYTILRQKDYQIWDVFFALAKLNEGRRSSATLTGVAPNAVRLRAGNPADCRPKPARKPLRRARGVQSNARVEKTPNDDKLLA